MTEQLEICKKCFERLGIEAKVVKAEDCLICSGLLFRIEEIAKSILKKLKDYEFKTFSVGCRLEGSIKTLEEYLFEKFGIDEKKSVKQQFNRELTFCLEKYGLKKSKNPEVAIIYNFERQDFDISIHPIFIYGRYIKRVRGISQTRWPCSCKNGCTECNFTGRRYISVEEIIAEPCIKIFKAKDAVLHGAGREDIDARMLGNGRPFVLEVVEPKKRYVDLKEVEEAINSSTNKVKVKNLKFVDSKAVEFIKNARFNKVYRAKVLFDEDVESKLKNAIEKLKGVIAQRTPKRVEHRRVDLVRKRRVYDIKILFLKKNIAVLEIRAESGLYIKELVSGDDGRTNPSLSDIIGTNARVEKLDVIKVEGGLEEALNT